ncbi:MAG: biopolymer transporter TolR [Marinilabiliales bacterium]|nr:biopolymer transporter TolR [Marinilabiliales bacterium]
MKKMVFLLVCAVLGLEFTLPAQQLGIFKTAGDIGSPAIKGTTRYDSVSQSYHLTGGGSNMWNGADQFHFASLPIEGDFILTTSLQLEGKEGDPHRKAGVILRQDLTDNAPYADVALHGDGLTSLQYRTEAGGMTSEAKSAIGSPEILQLERKGDSLIMRCAVKGEELTETGRILLHLNKRLFVGLFACAHNPQNELSVRFSNVRLDIPAAENVDGYKSPAASRLELIDVTSRERQVIYTTTTHIEAPNWSRDGSFLLYNAGGEIYRFPLKKGKPEKLNTGEVKQCNNDHGLSFDGKTLAISANGKAADGKSGSSVYTLPANGGIPRLITQKVPSYWHGWSPDGKTLVYCAERNGDYDVWAIPSAGGEEIRLTNTPGLDDGPEYAPDGKRIYFNSVRSGMMKIWSMAPDGSQPQQVSHGKNNDWFAHPSPDGTKVVYVSFPPSVPAGSHPMNQRVQLVLQDLSTGQTTVIASLYGGQGTINVPSWSPDSKKIAFVSYTYGNPEQ